MPDLTFGIVSRRLFVRKAIFSLLTSLSLLNLSIVVDAETLTEASDQIIASKPQVLLIDCVDLSFRLASIRKVRLLSPSTKCLLLASTPDEVFAMQAACSGAWGVITEESDPALIQRIIEKVVAGEMWFAPQTLSKAFQTFVRGRFGEASPRVQLAPREREVLGLLAVGYRNKQIASRLALSESTVRTYLETIYRKLGVTSRTEAISRYNDSSILARQPPRSPVDIKLQFRGPQS